MCIVSLFAVVFDPTTREGPEHNSPYRNAKVAVKVRMID